MKFLPLLFIGITGCAMQRTPDAASAPVRESSTVVISRDAVISTTVSPIDHRRFVKAILASAKLESDLPGKLAGTPYRMEHFSMSAVAPEIFYIVAHDSGNRDAWLALSKVHAYADGEYAAVYRYYENAAKREFPGIFCRACRDWDSLVNHAPRSAR